ncbi:MAG TPA: adenylate/guanylate cyclase domain-containing protein [Actinomycetota bacterium]|nr:adenylate/guanylate cyclase domain-containing protein [Actinomycetota bacterium]
MNMRQAIIAALRGDPEVKPKLAKALRTRIDGNDGRMSTVVQAAGALAPILEDAVRKRPSRLGKLGLRSAHMLAGLAAEDEVSNKRLAAIAHGGSVGIVFADVVDFTRYTATYGDPDAIELLNRLRTAIERKSRSCNGEVVKSLGDGFLLAFPSASQAVRGALSIRDAVQRIKTSEGGPPRLAIAVHAGEPLVEGDDLLGHDVNLTARLLDHCEPGEIVVSRPAKELAERRLKKITFGRERRVKVRGLAGTKTIYSANPQSEISDRGSRTSSARRPRVGAP